MKKNNIYIIVGIISVLAVVGVFWLLKGREPSVVVNVNPDTLPGIQKRNSPWPAEIANLKERLKAVGLPALKEEGVVLHTHQHIDIFIEGQAVQVPLEIGINEAQGFISPIHTHDFAGIIHVESPKIDVFTLGQFFDIWGVRFTSDCIGGYCSQGDKTIKVFSNGNVFTGDPRTMELKPRQEIVVTYGAPEQIPNPVPSSYSFPEGF